VTLTLSAWSGQGLLEALVAARGREEALALVREAASLIEGQPASPADPADNNGTSPARPASAPKRKSPNGRASDRPRPATPTVVPPADKAGEA
jgi:hypothetical protein